MRERVLNAALELLAEQGVRKLTQPQVAERAGVRQSHVTYYFPHRSDLIGAVARRYIETAAIEMMQIFSLAEREDLGRLLIAFAYKQVADQKRARTLMGLLVASEEDPALREILIDSMMSIRAVMAQAMGVAPGDPRAAVVQATFWGLGINNLLIGGDEAEVKRLVDVTAKLTGLRKGRKR